MTARPARVSLRQVDDDGQARDVVGDLVLADEHRIVVLPAGRGPVEVPRAQVRAMRRVPPRMVRPTSKVDDLQRLMSAGWPGLGSVRMGGWLLRTGEGYTRRANSCLPTGTPERPLDEAIEGVRGFYEQRGITPAFQIAARADEPASELERRLGELGWCAEAQTIVMTAALDAEVPTTATEVEWSPRPSGEWLALQPSDHPAREAVLTAVEAQYAGLMVDGRVCGTGRLVLTDDWAGIASVFIDPSLRGHGHGRALTIAMMARARELGARFCYLQVDAGNEPARALYASLGFVEHHRYAYWVPQARIS